MLSRYTDRTVGVRLPVHVMVKSEDEREKKYQHNTEESEAFLHNHFLSIFIQLGSR